MTTIFMPGDDRPLASARVAFLLSALAALTLAACGQREPEPEPTPEPEPAQEIVRECTFPDSPEQPAPLWVCGAPLEGIPLSAVGSYPQTGAGLNFQRQQAMTAARVELAQTLSVKVGNLIKQYAETTGIGDSETVDQVASSTTKQITNETLVGSRLYRQIVNPSSSTMYVLVGLGEEGTLEAVRGLVETAASTSQGDERAAWQRVQADKSQAELADAIASQ